MPFIDRANSTRRSIIPILFCTLASHSSAVQPFKKEWLSFVDKATSTICLRRIDTFILHLILYVTIYLRIKQCLYFLSIFRPINYDRMTITKGPFKTMIQIIFRQFKGWKFQSFLYLSCRRKWFWRISASPF